MSIKLWLYTGSWAKYRGGHSFAGCASCHKTAVCTTYNCLYTRAQL